MNTRTEGRSVIYVGGFPVGTVCSTDVMMVPTYHHWSLGKKEKYECKGVGKRNKLIVIIAFPHILQIL